MELEQFIKYLLRLSPELAEVSRYLVLSPVLTQVSHSLSHLSPVLTQVSHSLSHLSPVLTQVSHSLSHLLPALAQLIASYQLIHVFIVLTQSFEITVIHICMDACTVSIFHFTFRIYDISIAEVTQK